MTRNNVYQISGFQLPTYKIKQIFALPTVRTEMTNKAENDL